MLNRVHAQGFRSLDHFEMGIHPGLNVLVGPNGGGKTNILALLSFISALSSYDLGEAINASGGASKVFKKTSGTAFGKELAITASGEMKYDRTLYLPSNYERYLLDSGFVSLRYEWSLIIDSNLGYDETFYSYQRLRAKVVTSTLFAKDGPEWDIEVSCTATEPQAFLFEEIIHNEQAAVMLRSRDRKAAENSAFFIDATDDYVSTLPIFYAIPQAQLLRRLSRDLRSGSIFNFDPAVCKKPNDSAQAPVLEKNGDGLASTIYAIQKSSDGARERYIYSPRNRFSSKSSNSLQKYFQLVNPSISGVNARNNPFDNKITVNFSVDSENAKVSFPLDLASDGTVKWLAFVVALLTEDSGFAIEEPENFLHPDIQRYAIDLVRSETESSENLFVLMTTHSETILNASRPEEIIIVSMDSAITSARRLSDPKLIDEEISRTGFGLGYYYISGALND